MINYYRENESGDYMAMVTEHRHWIGPNSSTLCYDGRATAIAGMPSSMASTSATRKYLRTKCRRVAKRDVPQEWLDAIGEWE